MKYYSLLALAGSIKTATAIECFSCTADFDSNADNAKVACWTPTTTAPSGGVETATVTGVDRCFTSITFNNGYPVMIQRFAGSDSDDGVIQEADDNDAALDFSLNSNTCRANTLANWALAQFSDDNVMSVAADTSCMYDCATDNCNNQIQLSQYTMCSQIEELANKWCDYTTGIWHCDYGYFVGGVEASGRQPTSAQECELPTVTVTNTFTAISCVQCNSMTDGEDCFTKTAATSCNDESYVSCFSTSAVTYERHSGDVLLQTVTKGCSMDMAPSGVVHDQCFWNENTLATEDSTFDMEKDWLTDNYDHGYELICTQRCDPSGMYCDASSTPNGMVEEDTIYCAQYDSDEQDTVKQDADFSSWVTACPIGTTMCYSKTTYMLRMHNYFMMPSYSNAGNGYDVPVMDSNSRTVVISQKRGCMDMTTPQVEEAMCMDDAELVAGDNVMPMVTRTTCMDKCVGNYCNAIMWPNRPMCLQSDEDAYPIEYKAVPYKTCDSPAEDSCYIAQYNFLSPSTRYHRDQAGNSEYLSDGQDTGLMTQTSRGCMIMADGFFMDGCNIMGMRDDHEYFESCNFTCATHGCNFGSAYSGAFVKLVSPVVVVVAMVFGNL